MADNVRNRTRFPKQPGASLTFDRERMMGRQPGYGGDVSNPDVVRTGSAATSGGAGATS